MTEPALNGRRCYGRRFATVPLLNPQLGQKKESNESENKDTDNVFAVTTLSEQWPCKSGRR